MVGLLILLLLNYMSGFSVFRIFFKNTNNLERVILPNLLGLVTTPFTFLLLYSIIGFNLAVYALPLVIFTYFLISFKLKQKTAPSKLSDKRKIILLLVILGLLTLLTLPVVIQMPYFLQAQEISHHISIANEIKNLKVLPPGQPYLYNEKLPYQWIYHLMLALMSIYSGMPVLFVIHIFKVYLAVLFFSGLFVLGYDYFKNFTISIFLMAFISLFWSFNLYTPATEDYAIGIIVLIFYTFLKSVKSKSYKFSALTGILTASLMYIHGFSFIFAAFIIYSFLLYWLIADRKNFKRLLAFLLPLILVIPYYLYIGDTAKSMFLFEPFAGMVYSYPKLFHILLLFLPFGAYKAIKTKDETQVIFLILFASLFTFVCTLVMTHSMGIMRFVDLMIFPITFLSLNYMKGLRAPLKYASFIICTLLFVYPALSQLNLYFFTQNVLTKDEYHASIWVKDNSNANDVVLMSPMSFYPAITERKVVIDYPVMLSAYHQDPRGNFIDVAVMYTDPSQELYKKYNISCIFLCDSEFDFLKLYNLTSYNFSKSPAFKTVFKYGNCTVFKVVDLSSLPQFTNRNIEDKLIAAKYSRWWIVDY